jgi:DNA-binding IclR family transcriptional regulator
MQSPCVSDPAHSLVTRVDTVLGAFDADHNSLSLGGIVARTGLPKTTVLRLVGQLVKLGWMDRDHDRYVLGTRPFELSCLAWTGAVLRELAQPFLQDLYEATHETVHLAVLHDRSVLYLDKIAGHRRVAVPSRVGGRMPTHCTALGKVLLAHAPATLEKVVADRLEARTPMTIVSPGQLRSEIAQVSEEGVGFDREETVPGVSCVAVPIFGPDRACLAAVSVTGPTNRLPLIRLSSAIRTTATGVSRALRERAGGDGASRSAHPVACS